MDDYIIGRFCSYIYVKKINKKLLNLIEELQYDIF